MEKRTILILSFLVLAVVSRFAILAGPQWANFSPMGAMALFAGYYVKDVKCAVFYTLFALWVSNLLLNNLLYQAYFNGFSWGLSTSQFLLFAGVTLMGTWFRSKNTNVLNVTLLNLVASVLFFVLSNLEVWAFSSEVVYTKDFAGLSACYVNAIPFFPNSLYSHLLFGALFFGSFEFLKTKFRAIA